MFGGTDSRSDVQDVINSMLAIGICSHDPPHLRHGCPYVTQASLERASFPEICHMTQDVHRRHYTNGIKNWTPGWTAPIIDDKYRKSAFSTQFGD